MLTLKEIPDLVGREKELDQLKVALEGAAHCRGATHFISGEAGIGKTRLTNEFLALAARQGAIVLRGWCLAESLEPLMPMRTAFRGAGLDHLFTGERPPNLLSLFLMNKAGVLISRSERVESGLEPDIFAGMLTAVSNFVKDSLANIGPGQGDGLNIMGYGDYRIIMEHSDNCSIAAVISGKENELLLDDLKKALVDIEAEYSSTIAQWSGNVREVAGTEVNLNHILGSGKYEGRLMVDDPRILQENLFDNVLLGLQRLSWDKTAILFLDDIHWCDPTSLNLLHYLSRNIRNSRVLIIGTFRPEDLLIGADGTAHPLEKTMQNMSRENLFKRIELSRLGEADTTRLVNDVLSPNSLSKGFFERLHRETEGTPFYILEVTRLLVQEGRLKTDRKGSWNLTAEPDELAIPSKVYDVVRRRLDRLTKAQLEILETASVIGQEFDSDTVSLVLGTGRIVLLKELSEIERAHRLIHSSQKRYSFDHAKVREVLYNGIMGELRQEYHRMVGEALLDPSGSDQDAILSQLAYHFYAAGDTRAGTLLARAGNRAKANYSNAEAVLSYIRALEHITDQKMLLEVHKSLGTVYELTAEYEKSLEHLKLALGSEEDPGEKAALHYKTSQIYDQMGNYEESVNECLKGLAVAENLGGIKKASILSLLGWTYLKFGDQANAEKCIAQSLELAMPGGTLQVTLGQDTDAKDIRSLANAMNLMGLVFQYKGELARALELFGMAHELFGKVGRKSDEAIALINIANTYIDMGELDKALSNHEGALAINKSVGAKSSIAHSLTCLGYTYFDMGEYHKVIECQEKSIVMCSEIGYRSLQIYNYYSIAEAMSCLGRIQDAIKNAREALHISYEMSFPQGEAMGSRALGMAYREAGEWGAASEEFGKSLRILEGIGERRELARTLYEIGMLHLAKGEPLKANELFEKALSEYEGMGMRLWAERARGAMVKAQE